MTEAQEMVEPTETQSVLPATGKTSRKKVQSDLIQEVEPVSAHGDRNTVSAGFVKRFGHLGKAGVFASADDQAAAQQMSAQFQRWQVHRRIQIARHEDGKRRVVSLAEINGMEGEIITMSDIFAFRREGLDEDGNVLGALKPTGIVPSFHKKLAAKGIKIPIECFQEPMGGF